MGITTHRVGMDSQTQLPRLARRFAEARGIKLETVARNAVGSATFWDRLAIGAVTFRTAQRMLRWLSDNWPEVLEWPPDIPRPEPTAAVGAGPKGAA